MANELEELEVKKLQEEIAQLQRKRQLLQTKKALELELLANKVRNVPVKLESEHPVLGFLARQGFAGSKYLVNKARKSKYLKRLADAYT